MKRLLILVCLLHWFVIPVNGLELEAPRVPDSGRQYMPDEVDTFGEGVMEILKDALAAWNPDLLEAGGICFRLIAVVMVISVVRSFPGTSQRACCLVSTVLVSLLLLGSSRSLIGLGTNTVRELSEYGKLLLPVMTAALAAQGGVTKSSALYAGTAIFNSFLTGLLTKLLIPLIYIYLALAIANGAVGEDMLKKMKGFLKWAMTWVIKIVLYVFTGYMGITGVVSGATDAAALKATKLTISGMVPVVGGILADASESVLVSASLVKNTAGVYGLLALTAVAVGPFVKIGSHYLLLKSTAGICDILGNKEISALVSDFSGAMGLLLAVTGSVCLLFMISVVCFLQGVG